MTGILRAAWAPALAGLGLGLLPGCSPGALNRPTTLRFTGITDAEADAIEQSLRADGLTLIRRDGPTTTFETDSITSFSQLASAHARVRAFATSRKMELEFDGVILDYSTLSASGTATTTVSLQASPGATALIADQDGAAPWRRIALDSRGRWKGAVRTSGPVTRTGGWLYVAFTRDNTMFRYLRVNVLSQAQEATDYSAVQSAGLGEPKARTGWFGLGGSSVNERASEPARDSAQPPARDGRAAPRRERPPSSPKDDPDSGSGFKWPWEE